MSEIILARRNLLLGLAGAVLFGPMLAQARAQTPETTATPGTTATPTPEQRPAPPRAERPAARQAQTPQRPARRSAAAAPRASQRSWVGRRADDVERGTRPVRRAVGNGVQWVGRGMARGGRAVAGGVRRVIR